VHKYGAGSNCQEMEVKTEDNFILHLQNFFSAFYTSKNYEDIYSRFYKLKYKNCILYCVLYFRIKEIINFKFYNLINLQILHFENKKKCLIKNIKG